MKWQSLLNEVKNRYRFCGNQNYLKQSPEGEGNGKVLFNVYTFLFGIMKNFWKWLVVMVAQFVNKLNATQLCIKNGKFYVLYVFVPINSFKYLSW